MSQRAAIDKLLRGHLKIVMTSLGEQLCLHAFHLSEHRSQLLVGVCLDSLLALLDLVPVVESFVRFLPQVLKVHHEGRLRIFLLHERAFNAAHEAFVVPVVLLLEVADSLL